MTAPQTDNFEEWWEEETKNDLPFGKPANKLLAKAWALSAWTASRIDAEKKIEMLTKALEVAEWAISKSITLDIAQEALAEIKELE